MKAGWQRESLDALCLLVTDGTHSSPKTVSSGRPYITVRDISNGVIDFENCSFIDEVDYTQLCKNGCNPALGDVLFSKDGNELNSAISIFSVSLTFPEASFTLT